MQIHRVECGPSFYFVLVDEHGYPRAQGSRELCERSMEVEEMARPKGSAGSKKKTSALQAALDFVACAVTENSEPWKASLQFKDGYVIAFNGVLAAGCKAEAEFNACPHFGFLRRALERSTEVMSFTQLDAGKVAVTSGKFKAVIPCLDPITMPPVMPDANIAPATDALRAGFELLGPIIKEHGATVVEASLLLRGGSMVACDRQLIFEYWHGIDLPPDLVLPKAFLSAVVASKTKIVGFGYTPNNSITLHFEDGAWIKTQLFNASWPKFDFLAAADPNACAAIPEGLFDAVQTVLPFSEDGIVRFGGTAIRSHEHPGQGASFDFNTPPGFAYSGTRFMLLKGRAETIDFNAKLGMCFFFSNTPPMRGALVGHGSNVKRSQPDANTPVPEQFRPEVQQPPQEAQGEPLPSEGGTGSAPGPWNAPEPTPAAGTWGEIEAEQEPDDFENEEFASDPANAWQQNAEPPAADNGGWKVSKSVPIPD